MPLLRQAVSCQHLTVEARTQSRGSQCGVCGGQCDIEAGFFQGTLDSPTNYHSTSAPLSFMSSTAVKMDHLVA
jgi:hypothetical protein